MTLRRPTKVELAAQFILLASLLMLGVDLIRALQSGACLGDGSIDASSDCYPWGAEGPFAASWHYASKSNYLISSGIALACISAGLILPLIVGKRFQSLLLMGLLTVATIAIGYI